MQSEHFDAAKSELLTGVNLIEASAGTGKTYAIAMLVLRFVVEQGMQIDELLIVTFTNAATEELKDRIRARLVEAKRALEGVVEGVDSNVLVWLQTQPVAAELAVRRLQLAILEIDRAEIHTIHGFCQRVLREHALESGQLFDIQLCADVSAIRQQLADDFWRRHVYPRAVWEAVALTAVYSTPDALLASIDKIPAQCQIVPVVDNLQKKLEVLGAARATASIVVDKNAEAIQKALAEGKFKKDYVNNFELQWQYLSSWLHSETEVLADNAILSLLTTQGLMAALNGNQFRNKQGISGADRKAAYIDTLGVDTTVFNDLLEHFKNISVFFRRALVEYLHEHLGKELQQQNVLSFDNLITGLSAALQGGKGVLLRVELQRRFKAVLIDEFQDTDNSQWHIFSTLFAVQSHFLYLIGDPKQAIYKFRGADIFSYFEARKQADRHYTLIKNWRSHPSLVEAVNVLFKHNRQPFYFEHLDFIQIQPALSAAQGSLTRNGQPIAPMQLWQLQESDASTGFWSAGQARSEIQTAVVNEIIELLDDSNGVMINSSDHNKNRPLQAGDIAVLVRSNAQAREFQSALQGAMIPAVLNSTESVFFTREAYDLWLLLQALAHPGDINLLKQALTLDWFDLDGQAFFQTGNDEAALDAWASRFQGYYQDWQEKGLMTMLQQLLAKEQVLIHLSRKQTAERRLTNIQHLIELVQQTAIDEHLGINKTLDWLAAAIKEQANADDQQLRLESDDEAVKIVTMHRAKGLEYPVVFCPFLWGRNKRLDSEQELIKCHVQGEMIVDLGSSDFAQYRQIALQEELAEELRLLYVALTRAKYCCYLTWADERSKNIPNKSALAYLLFAKSRDGWPESLQTVSFAQQQNTLKSLADAASDCFLYHLLTAPTQVSGYYQSSIEKQNLAARYRHRQLLSYWQMSSYTALASLTLTDVPELPQDKAQEAELLIAVDDESAKLPKGTHTGNVVHDLLEKNDFQALAAAVDISSDREQACRRYGLLLDQPEILDDLLRKVVLTPLSNEDLQFYLANLNDRQCLKEMPFYLSMQYINARQINNILKGTSAFQSLSEKQLQGYLTGFIDLICEYNGRFYIIDYKTNSLPDYQSASLLLAMQEHNYGLQYWIYALVLHQYLQNRLSDYQYAKHFGGVRYLFVRGMQPDQPMSGVFQDIPDLPRLNALTELFVAPVHE
jgi:exodeoxyribonuclease V beta subunit